MGKDPKIVWDLPTRITHWALAACVVLNLFFLEEGGDWHERLGYVSVALVAFRFFWGFVGGAAPRFRAFPVSPGSLGRFFRGGLNDTHYAGHNPLSSLVYLAIWGCVIALGVTGFMATEIDRYWGEDWVKDLHANFSLALQVLLGIHLLGVFSDSVRHRRHTWLTMVTGKKG